MNKNYKHERLKSNPKRPAKPSDVEVINFNIEIPKFDAVIGKNNIIENGKNNNVYDYVDSAYNESPTLSAIVNGFQNYIIGDGLYDINGNDIYNHIEQEDVELLCLDFKKFGAFAVQILWNLDQKVQTVKYLNVKKILLQIDDFGEVIGYYYSFDLKNQSKYPLKWFPKFDGNFKQNEEQKFYSEILVIQRPSSNDWFSNCDFVSALPFAKLEGQLAITAIEFSNQSFRGSTIVNMNGAIPPTDELKKQYQNKIVDSLSGSNNSGRIIVSFNENADQQMYIENIPLPEINDTYNLFSDEAQLKIITASQMPPVLVHGMRSSSNLGLSKDELKTATQSLYTRSINPMRNTITNGLMKIFKKIDPNIQLKFKDFDWLKEEVKNEPSTNE